MSIEIAAERVGGFRWLKPSATAIATGRRAVVVEKCFEKPCWEGVVGREEGKRRRRVGGAQEFWKRGKEMK